jgi:hypothetical protein
MRKQVYFDTFEGRFWPAPYQLQPYFLGPKGQEWFFETGNDSACLTIETGPEDVKADSYVRVDLYINGHRDHGVTFAYGRWDGSLKERRGYSSKGDLSRLHEFVYSQHGTPLSLGLFVPFPAAWQALKEFIETDGQLPKNIEWINDDDLPPSAFPIP